jgi:hypothetical protein
VYFVAQDDNVESFRFSPSAIANKPFSFMPIKAATKSPLPLVSGSIFNYPITIRRLEFRVFGIGRVDGKRYTGSFIVDNLRVSYPPAVTAVEKLYERPEEFCLFQNFPNPFNPITAIRYKLSANSYIHLKIYDILGRNVETLVQGIQNTGIYTIKWDASGFPSGIYFCRLQAGSHVETKRMLLLK